MIIVLLISTPPSLLLLLLQVRSPTNAPSAWKPSAKVRIWSRTCESTQDTNSAAALMGLVAAAEFGYMRNQHQQQQHTTQQQQQQQQQLHQQQQQQQQQHPDSTATDVARRSSSSSSYQGECEEKRSGRNFQVSRREVNFFLLVFIELILSWIRLEAEANGSAKDTWT